ncbi:MAG: hypothetical protein IPP30_01605 [Flavobacterium sp.]|nr:hypothetical protein [Flavobacterium sp.]
MRKYFTSAVCYLFVFSFLVSSCTSDGDSNSPNEVGALAITTTEATLINLTTATVGGKLLATGGGTITSRGVCYSTEPNPTIEDTKISKPGNLGTFTCQLSGLTAATQYYVRAYASNVSGLVYGQEITFTTTAELVSAPIITTADATEITETTATSGGNVISAGGSAIISRGICWATTENPSLLNNVIEASGSTGIFSSSLIGLDPETTYYVRAYATNSVGTSYGNQITFVTATESAIELPTVMTTEPTDITETSAISGGDVTSIGGAPITARGICWSTTPSPTTADNVVPDTGSTGPFTSEITGLSTFTIYYVRAFATNAGGTSYGEEFEFSTN